MVAEKSARRARRGSLRDLALDRRGWVSHSVAAVAVSALGLAVAGSLPLTTSAETLRPATPAGATALPASGGSGLVGLPAGKPGLPQPGLPQPAQPQSAGDESLEAFLRADAASAASRSAQLRTAIVNERAAQRTEDLSALAEDVERQQRKQVTAARQAELAKTQRDIRKNAVQIAQDRQRRAMQARVAAEVAREVAEAQARADAAARARAVAAASARDRANAAARAAAAADAAASISAPRSSAPRFASSTSSTGGGGGSSSSGSAASPVPRAVIGAPFGAVGSWSSYHTGIDFRAGYGVPIRAVKSGRVLYAGSGGSGGGWAGTYVAVRHGDGMTTMSSHMSALAVRSGETVSAGQVIGYVGQTGRAFGAHLHFELYPRGVRYGDVYRAINPQPWLSAAGVRTR